MPFGPGGSGSFLFFDIDTREVVSRYAAAKASGMTRRTVVGEMAILVTRES